MIIKIDDTVLVFNRFEGTVVGIEDGQLVIYCPEYDDVQPYLVTDPKNVILLKTVYVN
jgi:hypothetical protein